MENPLIWMALNGYLTNIENLKLVDHELHTSLKYCFNYIVINSEKRYNKFIEICEYCRSNKIYFMIGHLYFNLNIPFKYKFINIKEITFGDDFNQKIENLPESLINLTFGQEFNQKIENLPESLTHLTFGERFNQKIENLPESLTHLTFGYWFNQKIENLPE